jgi:hypothetical protein
MSIETDRDRVRLMIGDTDESDPLLSDDEIAAFVAYRKVENEDEESVTNIPAAAADAADAIAAKFARKFNFAEDGQRFDVAQQHGHYLALAQRLRTRAGGVSAPYREPSTT